MDAWDAGHQEIALKRSDPKHLQAKTQLLSPTSQVQQPHLQNHLVAHSCEDRLQQPTATVRSWTVAATPSMKQRRIVYVTHA